MNMTLEENEFSVKAAKIREALEKYTTPLDGVSVKVTVMPTRKGRLKVYLRRILETRRREGA